MDEAKIVKKQVMVRLPVDMLLKLKHIAVDNGGSVSETVEMVLKRWLEHGKAN